jgi:hypothetical protein
MPTQEKRKERFHCSEAGGQEVQEVMALTEDALTGVGVPTKA